MVVVGNFSACIVNAEDKKAFKEHTGPGGKTFAEVEPGVEYFIEVEVIGGDPNSRYYFEFSVDGRSLGYHKLMRINAGKGIAGSWSRVGGVSTHRAFKLQRPVFSHTSESVCGFNDGLMGDVKITISEATASGTYTQSDWSGKSIETATISSGISHGQTKKVLRSGEGSTTLTTTPGNSTIYTKYVHGKLLETITINYCTALGLIHAGVLDKPNDIWEQARLTNPSKKSSNRHAVNVGPKCTKMKDVAGGGKVKVEVKAEAAERELFDMTNLPDSVSGIGARTRSNASKIKVEKVAPKEYVPEMFDLSGLSSDDDSDDDDA